MRSRLSSWRACRVWAEPNMIDVYFWPTPNGKKVTVMLEECGLPYRLVPVNIARGDQFTPEFLAISPNNCMPAILDNEPLGAGAPLSVGESGAILMYLAEKSGRHGGQTPRERYAILQWVMWQMANQGPKSGERGYFQRAAMLPENGALTYPLRRFGDAVNRTYGVLNNQLYRSAFLAGAGYSIADLICYPWAAWAYLGENIEDFPYLKRWLAQLPAQRAGVLQNQRARPVAR